MNASHAQSLDAFLSTCALLCQQQKYRECISLIKQNISPQLKHPRLMFILAFCHQQVGQLNEAIDFYRHCIALQPDYVDAYQNLGNLLHTQDKIEPAIRCYEKALAINPLRGDGCNNLANILQKKEKYQRAVKYHKRAIRLEPQNARYYNNLAFTLSLMDRFEEAISAYRFALRYQPDYAEAKNGLQNVLIQTGKIKQACYHIEQNIKQQPNAYHPYCQFVKVASIKHSPEYIDKMESIIHGPISHKGKIHLAFALGKACDEIGRFDDAFAYWSLGNRLKRETIQYSIHKDIHFFNELKKAFPTEFIASHQNVGFSSRLPIFIVGMPRSGTTLVEQILASHPHVLGAGELKTIARLSTTLVKRFKQTFTYPDDLTKLDKEAFEQLGKDYIRALNIHDPSIQRVCDKMPHNFLHLGFISLILPHAKIIHCRRHPLDTCLSCFSNYFGDEGMNFAYNLDELTHYYRLYSDLMQHWRDVLHIPMFEIQYEQLVDHLEESIQSLLDFCGLPWDDRCMAFYKTPRAIKTASYVQVRKPIYKDSIERWRRYEKQMGGYLPQFE